jgi:hypothetical protein
MPELPKEPENPPHHFPLETIFPGIHAERPDISEADAQAFLSSGHKVGKGFDPLDPEIRADLIDCPPKEFVEFKVEPIPAPIAAMLAELSTDAEKQPGALAVTEYADGYLKLPPHLRTILLPGKELWIWPA